jgi:hypothetical protein
MDSSKKEIEIDFTIKALKNNASMLSLYRDHGLIKLDNNFYDQYLEDKKRTMNSVKSETKIQQDRYKQIFAINKESDLKKAEMMMLLGQRPVKGIKRR